MIGRRRLDVHIHAFEQLGAWSRSTGRSSSGPAPARRARLPRRGERDGDRERGHGSRARRGRDRDRRHCLRAACPGPLPVPRLARRADPGDRVERAADPRRRSARRRRVPDRAGASRSRASSALPPSPAAISGSTMRRPEGPRCRSARLARLGVRVEGSRGRACTCRRALQGLQVQDDLGDQIPKIEDGPWPAFPADLTSIALAVATQARDEPHLREDVREPPVLRRQARSAWERASSPATRTARS